MHSHHPGDQDKTVPDHPLTEAELTAARFPALMALAAIRGDSEAMGTIFESAIEHMTIGRMIESMAIELAVMAIDAHGSSALADKVISESVLKMNAGTL